MNRLTSETDPFGATTRRVYDAVGNVIATIDPRGYLPGNNADDYTTSYGFDGLSRMLAVTSPPVTSGSATPHRLTVRRTYDAAGNLLTETDAAGRLTTYTYDGRDLRLTMTQQNVDGDGRPFDSVTTYTYDGYRDLVKVTDANGHATSLHLRCSGPVDRHACRGDGGPALHTHLDYDEVGNVVRATQGAAVTLHRYYPTGWLREDIDAEGNTFQYVYDGIGGLIRTVNQRGFVTSYAYDGDDSVQIVNPFR